MVYVYALGVLYLVITHYFGFSQSSEDCLVWHMKTFHDIHVCVRLFGACPDISFLVIFRALSCIQLFKYIHMNWLGTFSNK